MNKRKAPVEIAGYVNRQIWVVGEQGVLPGFKCYSWVNDDHKPEDYLEWDGDSTVDDCPF
ncbi:MAG: hypothetical protein JWQ16_808 [Novosphingobium sp.]|nr:hypothetical protein [Novosphingobium sp.]